jgi:hypothetical protein
MPKKFEFLSFWRILLATMMMAIMAAPSLRGQGGNTPPDEEVMFNVTWGDDSGSQSESYTLTIPNAEPARLPKSKPGQLKTKPLALRKGTAYTLTMNHVSTTLNGPPDYDYTLKVDGKSGKVITVLDKGDGGTWLMYDKNKISGVHWESDEFYAAGEELLLLPVEVEQKGYTSAKGIRFCRWLDAFSGGLLDPEFADKDRDRFRIKIPGIIPNLTKIKIKSTGLHGAVIDGAVVAKANDGDYEVEMKQENGAIVSNWILLVSDGDDDKNYNGKGTDDGKNDQTLLADFKSKIIVTLPELEDTEVEFAAQKPLGNITLDTVYLSPAGDVPEVMQDIILKQVAKMQEIYRQIGVRVAWASIEGVAIPQSWLDTVPNPDPTKPDLQPANRLNDAESQSARTLIRNRQVPAKHVRIGYVNATMKILDDNFLEKNVLGFTVPGTDGIVVSLGSAEAQLTLGVTAHEVGHTFGLYHVNPSDFLMKSPLRWENGRRDSKRFEEGNFSTIKNKEVFYVPMQ